MERELQASRALRADLADAMEKLGRMTGRLAKRAALEASRDAEQVAADPPEQGNGAPGGWVIHHGRAVRRVP